MTNAIIQEMTEISNDTDLPAFVRRAARQLVEAGDITAMREELSQIADDLDMPRYARRAAANALSKQ